MRIPLVAARATSLVALVVLVACNESGGDAAAPSAPSADPSAAPGGMPPGHPPMVPPGHAPGGGSDVRVAPPPRGSGTGETSLKWSVPPTWTEEQPSSAMRKAQYRIAGSAGDAELVIYYFGPNQGGDAQSNIQRWVSQFTQPDGRPSTEVMKVAQRTVGSIVIDTVEVSGTYNGGMMAGAAGAQVDQALLGAIAAGPDANWFFKLTGPKATVAEQRAAFDALLDSLRTGS